MLWIEGSPEAKEAGELIHQMSNKLLLPGAWRSTQHQHGIGFVQSRQSTVGGGEGTDLERATDRWKGEKEDEMLPAFICYIRSIVR